MLHEVPNVRQIPSEPRRRWFSSRRCDLIVWYDTANKPAGFQFCYRKRNTEKALTWRAPSSFLHSGVDDGEQRFGRYKATPILVADGRFDGPTVVALFRDVSKEVPEDIAELVIGKLTEYGQPAREKT